MFQAGAGKAGATEAVFDSTFHYLLAGLNSARNAGCRFILIVTAATRTCFHVLISSISTTEMTVHATGSNQGCANRIGLYRASCCHIRIPAEAENNRGGQRTTFLCLIADIHHHCSTLRC